MKQEIENKVIFISGGTGTLGKALTKDLLQYNPKKIIIYSRNEKNQYDMEKEFQGLHEDKLRFILGDICDFQTLKRAMTGVNIVFHTAALKHVNKCEYNPKEYIRTNINGSSNIIDSSIYNGIEKVIALSTDKASSPCTLYGGTKMVADKLFQSANVYSKEHKIKLMVVRYGNVAESNGSIIPYFKKLYSEGNSFPITDTHMTRFWIDIPNAIKLIYTALEKGSGGEIYVSKLPSFRIMDLVTAFGSQYHVIGKRENEKLHEELISVYDNCYEYDDYYIIYPNYEWYKAIDHIDRTGKAMPFGFNLTSDNNKFMTIAELKDKI